MDISLKQRLVGAIVLVALGVIFIPILLESREDESRLTVSMKIPPKPDLEFKDRLEDVKIPPEPEPLPSMKDSVGPLKEAREAEASATKVVPAAAAAAAKVPQKKPAQVAAAKPAVIPQATGVTAAKPASLWVVQVGSFSKQLNAQQYSDKLKAGGFKAYVEDAQTGAGAVYRVRIGPIAGRSEAEAVVKKLKEKGGHRGMVISYP